MCVCCRLDIHQRLLVSPMTNWHVGDTVHTHGHSAFRCSEKDKIKPEVVVVRKRENFVLAERCWRCSSQRKKERIKVMKEDFEGLERDDCWTELKFKENIQAENTKQIRCIPSTIPRTRFLLAVVVVTPFFSPSSSFLSLMAFFWEMLDAHSLSLALVRRPICSDLTTTKMSPIYAPMPWSDPNVKIVGPHRKWIWHLHGLSCTVRPVSGNEAKQHKVVQYTCLL